MSLQLGMTYEREDGATFIPWGYVDSQYEGEIADSRGTRRHVVAMNDHDEWKLRGNERGASEKFAVKGPDPEPLEAVLPQVEALEVLELEIAVSKAEEPTPAERPSEKLIVETKGERKVKNKR